MCIQTCGQDQTCAQGCVTAASPQAQQQFGALQQCFQASGCAQDDQQCLQSACSAQINSCSGSAGPGTPTGDTLSCSGILNCLNDCGPNDEMCGQQCFGNGSPTAQQLFNSVGMCAQNSNCPENDDQCFLDTCSNEINACTSDTSGGSGGPSTPPPSPGSLSCKDVIICAIACGEDATCQQGCIGAVNQQDAQTLDAYLMCSNQCDSADCVDMNCGPQQDACIPPGTQGCGSILTCFNGCQDETCLLECQFTGDDEAIDLLIALSECIQTAGCQGLPCPACDTETSACQND